MRKSQAQSQTARKSSLQSMPIDKHNSGISAKPLTPNLSSAFRHAKSPLTPKFFGSSNASPTLSAKQGLHTESATNKASNNGQSTPTSTFNGNITPRSAARKSRIGTESPSTSDGGNAVRSPRPRSVVEKDRPKDTSIELDISRVRSDTSNTPAPGCISSDPGGSMLTRKSSGCVDGPGGATTTPMRFFHADDAKSAVSSQSADERAKPGPRSPAFFYANEAAPTQRDLESRATSQDKQDGGNKFFYANVHNSVQPPATKASTVGKPISPSGASPRFVSPELQRNGKPAQRPTSPLKETSYTNAPVTTDSPRSKHVTSPGRAVYRGSPLPSPLEREPHPRRTSLSSTTSVLRRPAHQKSASTTSVQTTPTVIAKAADFGPMGSVSPKGTSTQQLSRSTKPPNSPELSTSNSTSLVSSDTNASSLAPDSAQSVAHASPLQSPTKSGSRPQLPAEQLQKMNEYAANARRERKVLDLEISNSSLLAINKTLEREMRKQSTELRRFRRLSRAGRFSMATGSLRSISSQSDWNALAEIHNGKSDLSDLEELSDQDSEISEDSDDDDLDSSFEDDTSALMSSTSRTEYDARHRARDEKRLMLDLSKHQQLLVDSQKMSQSIRRCLSWTDELIKDANRALAYNVKVSDVELGGRVLSRDDDEEDDDVGAVEEIGESSKGLLSPSLTMNTLDDVKLWANALSQLDGLPEGMMVAEPEELQPG